MLAMLTCQLERLLTGLAASDSSEPVVVVSGIRIPVI